MWYIPLWRTHTHTYIFLFILYLPLSIREKWKIKLFSFPPGIYADVPGYYPSPSYSCFSSCSFNSTQLPFPSHSLRSEAQLSCGSQEQAKEFTELLVGNPLTISVVLRLTQGSWKLTVHTSSTDMSASRNELQRRACDSHVAFRSCLKMLRSKLGDTYVHLIRDAH